VVAEAYVSEIEDAGRRARAVVEQRVAAVEVMVHSTP
jgi:hypothetical protein